MAVTAAAGMMLGLTACQAPGGGAIEPQPAALPAVMLPAADAAIAERPAWAENMTADRIEEALQRSAVATADDECDWVAVILSTTLMRQVCHTW